MGCSRSLKKRRKKKKIFVSFTLISVIFGSIVFNIFNEDKKTINKSTFSSVELKSSVEISEDKPVLMTDTTLLQKDTNHNIDANKYAYKTKEIRRYIENVVPYEGSPLVFLTFDDGINQTVTPRILDVLKRYNVPATFFVVGKYIDNSNKEILEREIKEGHSIALHSWSHDYSLLYPNGCVDCNNVVKEIKKQEQVLQKYLGKEFKSNVWRYPGGHMSWYNMEECDELLSKLVIEWIDWNAMVGDAEPLFQRPTTIEKMLIFHEKTLTSYPDNNVRVVLLHDAPDKQLTLEALPKLIEYYKEKNYSFGVLT